MLYPTVVNREIGAAPFKHQTGIVGKHPAWRNVGLDALLAEPQMVGNKVKFQFKGFHPPVGSELFQWGEGGGAVFSVDLDPGTYAVVRCVGDGPCFRAIHAPPARLGEAAGHAGLASEQPVLFAGEMFVRRSGSHASLVSTRGWVCRVICLLAMNVEPK